MAREILTKAEAQAQGTVPPALKDRLLKLIPAEIIAAYVTLAGLVEGMTKIKPNADKATLLYIIIGVLMVLTPVYLTKISGVTKKGQLLFSTIGFVIWAFATASPLKNDILNFPSEFIISTVLILYTLLIPFFYEG